jgi:hypothetical protein
MSGEWFQIARRPLASPGRHPLADPLEAEEWRGLDWVLPLLSWLPKTCMPVSAPRPRARIAAAEGAWPASGECLSATPARRS